MNKVSLKCILSYLSFLCALSFLELKCKGLLGHYSLLPIKHKASSSMTALFALFMVSVCVET